MDETTRGPYVHTWTGKKFYLLDPQEDDVCIEDIAHALSLQCRFNGHVDQHYSVAEHCLLVSNIVEHRTQDTRMALTALLHDAAEAYLGDVVSPLKKLLPDYTKFELSVESCIASKYALIYPFPEEVHKADKKALENEFELLPPFSKSGADYPFCPLSPRTAERDFLSRFTLLSGA